ncbi:MAG: hypothetical protein PUJ81_01915, partial [Lachnospiraceae bacterium]|nr:hypothetical protein [Lachnospiraceae bacterium]
VKRFDATLPQDKLDQIHLPDPVKEDIANLQRANSELINRVLELEARLKSIDNKVDSENQGENKDN